MATRAFFRDTTDNTAGYVATEKSTVLPVGTPNLSGAVARDLSTIAGASAVLGNLATLAQTAHQDGYFRKFISAPLAVSDITAQTWTLGVSVGESNNAANAFIVCSVYVLTSGDTVRGFVYDSDTPLGAEWSLGANAGRVVTFSGAAVSGVVSTDRLVVEFWVHGIQGMAASYTLDFGYNGTTAIVDGTANSDPASFIETPQDGLFGGGAQSIAVTAAVETETARPQGIGLAVLWATEFEVSTAWIDVGAALEVEAAQVVTPTAAAGEQTIPVGAASETEAAQGVTVTTTVTVTVTAAIETEAAQAVIATPGLVSVAVGAASESETAQTVTPAQGAAPQSVTVTAATETESAQTITINPGATTITVGAAVETETARVVGASQAGAPQTRPVDTATETEAAQAVTPIPGVIGITVGAVTETETAGAVGVQSVIALVVGAALETESAQAVGVIPGATLIVVGAAIETEVARQVNANQAGAPQTIPVTAATESEATESVVIDASISILVGSAFETEAAQAVATSAGPTSIPVGAAVETETAQPVLAVVGAQYDMIITTGGPRRGWRTGRLGQRWRTGGPTKT